jgi:lipopolysaccharide export system protein LptC
MNFARRLLDKLSVYLPMIVMALLASGSWWLVRSAPELLMPAVNKAVREEPDYRLENFTVKSFDVSGRMTREVSGDKAQHYPASETLDIEQIRIYAENETGKILNARSRQGIATDDGKQVTLIGDASAIRQAFDTSPQLELRGQRLVALPDDDRVVSSDPVQITRDRDVFTAQTMDFNTNTGEYLLKGRVQGTLNRKP